jgi:hypothetical protein
MLHLLLHASLFAPLPGGGYLQLTGPPLHQVGPLCGSIRCVAAGAKAGGGDLPCRSQCTSTCACSSPQCRISPPQARRSQGCCWPRCLKQCLVVTVSCWAPGSIMGVMGHDLARGVVCCRWCRQQAAHSRPPMVLTGC